MTTAAPSSELTARVRDWVARRREPFTVKDIARELGAIFPNRVTNVLCDMVRRGELDQGERLETPRGGIMPKRGKRVWVPKGNSQSGACDAGRESLPLDRP